MINESTQIQANLRGLGANDNARARNNLPLSGEAAIVWRPRRQPRSADDIMDSR